MIKKDLEKNKDEQIKMLKEMYQENLKSIVYEYLRQKLTIFKEKEK